LAVDLGLRAGLAVYGEDGRLQSCRSIHFGTVGRMKRTLVQVVNQVDGLSVACLEGDRHLADLWARAAERRGARVLRAAAESWRAIVLFPREARDGVTAKGSAVPLARRVVAWSGLSQPRTMVDDTAEAVLLGLWGVMEVGWLGPEALREVRAAGR
jgi:hypothetical protein